MKKEYVKPIVELLPIDSPVICEGSGESNAKSYKVYDSNVGNDNIISLGKGTSTWEDED